MFFWVFCVLPKPPCAALLLLQHTELELWGALVLNSFLFYIIVLCGSQGRGLVKSALGSCGQHEPGQQPLELARAAVVAVSPLCLCHPCLCSPPLSVRPGEQAEHREPWGAGMQHRLLVIPPLVRSAARGFAKHSRSFCIILYGQCLSAVIIWRSFPSIFCCYTAALCASPSSPVILELLF